MTDKAACDRFERSLDAYRSDALAHREREAARRHASSCPECLARLTRHDPLARFLPLSLETPSPRVTEGFWDAVRAGIEQQSVAGSEVVPIRENVTPSGWRAAFGGRRLAPVALAASFVVMVLAALFAAIAPGRIAPDTSHVAGVTLSPSRAMASSPSAVPGKPLPQTVEHVRTEDERDVQVYSMTWLDQDAAAAGHDPNQVTELILIVDAGLKL